MSYYQQSYNTREPYNPGSQPVYYMTDPAPGTNLQGDSQAVARWLTGQDPTEHFLHPGAEHSVARVNNPSIEREDREIGYLQRQYAQHARTWSQDTTSSVQSGFVPSPLPQPSMTSPPSPPLAPWSPSAPQYFGENPNAFAPPPSPSPPPPQTQDQGWVPQPHPQPAGGLGPSVVDNNNQNDRGHVPDMVVQYGYAPQQAYAYPQPTENISAWEFAYIPEVVQLNYANQAQSSLPIGPQQAYAGPESNYPHQHDTSSNTVQSFHCAEHHPSVPHVQHTPYVIQGGVESQYSALGENYAHQGGSAFPERASSSTADDQMNSDQMNSYSIPAATMVPDQVPESVHHDGSAKKAPKRTSRPKRQTKSRSKKATTPANQATATATEIAPPETAPVCLPGTVDPKDVFSNPNAGRVARPSAAAVKRRQPRAVAGRPSANSQASHEANSSPALGDENPAPVSNSLDARAQTRKEKKLARSRESQPLTYLPQTTGKDVLCFLCGYLVETGLKFDTRTGKGHRRGDKFKCHQFHKEGHWRCPQMEILKVEERTDKSMINIGNLGVWLLERHPKLAITTPGPFRYVQLGRDVMRELRKWWSSDEVSETDKARWRAMAMAQ